MNRKRRYFVNYSVMMCAGVFMLSILLGLIGMRLNISKSIPLGIYFEINKSFKKGDYVIFCPPKNNMFDNIKKRGYIGIGFCDGGYGWMMKSVAAVEGDSVVITENGVIINGEVRAQSQLHDEDNKKRGLPRYQPTEFIVKPAEVLLMGKTSTSFDGRYFGPIPSSLIKGVIHPVITWK